MIEETELVNIVGAGNFSFEQKELNEFSRDMSFVNAIKPECIVRPKSRDDIEKIVKLAKETLTPLVPVSSGSPHFRYHDFQRHHDGEPDRYRDTK